MRVVWGDSSTYTTCAPSVSRHGPAVAPCQARTESTEVYGFDAPKGGMAHGKVCVELSEPRVHATLPNGGSSTYSGSGKKRLMSVVVAVLRF